jgi:hypothetical protein
MNFPRNTRKIRKARKEEKLFFVFFRHVRAFSCDKNSDEACVADKVHFRYTKSMSFFCFLWAPFVYLFWRSLADDSERGGGAWALVLGSLAALVQFFLGAFISPGGFGLSRWVSACIDIVALPAAFPFILCFVFAGLRIIPADSNFTHLAFLWLIPIAALRALNWSAQSSPLLLIVVPILWTSVVIGMGFFVRMIQGGWTLPELLPAVAGAAALPFLGATCYWALFRQSTLLGAALFAATAAPAVISLGLSFAEARK